MGKKQKARIVEIDQNLERIAELEEETGLKLSALKNKFCEMRVVIAGEIGK